MYVWDKNIGIQFEITKQVWNVTYVPFELQWSKLVEKQILLNLIF